MQKIRRTVRVPFKAAFVTGNLKLRLWVEQSTETGEVRLLSSAFASSIVLTELV